MQSVYFVADDGTHGRELWRRNPDGTVALVYTPLRMIKCRGKGAQ